MILNPGEAIFCESNEELMRIAELLEDNGYKMYLPIFPSIPDLEFGDEGKYGFRFMEGRKFPNCIATLSRDQKKEIIETGKLCCNGKWGEFLWKMSTHVDGNCVIVEDLL